ncbi:MAG TPA: hypothetical protein VE177_04655, partial [Candidatus Binatus sp.]|nr:hypothetical protein [Candidatus Binatus sp.]
MQVNIVAGATGTNLVVLTNTGLTGAASLSSTVTPVSTNGPSISLSPAVIGFTAGGSENSTVTLATTKFTVSGDYIVTITGSIGGLSHTTTFSVRVTPDFTITASSLSPSTIVAGNTTSTTITLTSFGLTGSIGLSYGFIPVGTGLAASLNPSALTVTPGLLGTSTLVVSTQTSTPSGVYTLHIVGTAGLTSHIATLSFTVNPEFTISASGISPASFVASNSASSTVTLGSQGFNGTVTLSVIRSSIAIGLGLSSNSIHLIPGSSGTSILTVSTNSSTPAGSYTVTITGTSGSLTHSVILTVSVTGDFVVSTAPPSGSVVAGSSIVTTITMRSLGLTAGPSLTATIPTFATGLSTSFSPGIVPLTPGSVGTSVLTLQTIPGTPAGTYDITINGTSGSLVHSITFRITVVPDFTLIAGSFSPPSIIAGSSTSAVLTVQSLGLTTTVNLNVTLSSPPTGFTAALNPVLVGLTPGVTGNSTLTIATTASTPAGIYSFNVTGSSGTLVHRIILTIHVNPDFTVTATSISPAGFVAGGSAS